MLDVKALTDLVTSKDYTQADKILFCLMAGDSPQSLTSIRERLGNAGARSVKKWNLTAILNRCSEKVANTASGWVLTRVGREYVAEKFGGRLSSDLVAPRLEQLRIAAGEIENPKIRSFVTEAVVCLENRAFRAAVVLSWVGAMAILYQHVTQHQLAAFNAEAARVDPKWKPAKTEDDLAKMKEHSFLNIASALSVIGKNVKQDLESCLSRRNSCGHPNSFVLGEIVAAAHVETLINNVFVRFP